ncbi:MAG: SIR2 family protein, partial [Nitrospirae bacterium]|nr:SIR2 family protein [Nitrospirota bacterium]
ERKAGNILEGENRDARLISLYHLAVEASRLIEWMVAMSLNTERIIGLDLVAELAESQWIERLDIVTLNHDTLVEQVLTKNNIGFVDGFGSQDGDVRWQDDTEYDAKDAKVRLIKPHGSVNWYEFSVNGKERYAIIDGKDPTQCKNQKGERLKSFIATPSFLSGTNKVISYNRGIYTDVFYRFHKALRENDLMVMSGYGWGDTAINFRLENWVDYDKNNRIILLHENPKELMSRSLQLDQSYNGLVRMGQIVPVPQWLCNTSLSDLTRKCSRPPSSATDY